MSWWKNLIKQVAVIAAEGIAEAEAKKQPLTIGNIGKGAAKAITKNPDLIPGVGDGPSDAATEGTNQSRERVGNG